MKNLKKILAVILSILMVAAIPMTAFATYYKNPADRKNDPYSCLQPYYEDPMFPLENYTYMTGNASWQQYKYTDTDGTIYIYYTSPYDSHNWIVSKENPDYVYRDLPDGTIAIEWNMYTDNEDHGPVEMTVPSTLDGKNVSIIHNLTFAYSKSIRLPNTVKGINYDPFDRTVERVFIPASVEEICVDSIRYIDEVLYAGTEEQWNNIIFYNNPDAFMGYHYEAKYSDWDWEAYSKKFPDGKWYNGEIKFNCNPADYPEFEEEKSFLDKISDFFRNIAEAISNFFSRITGFFSF